MKCIAIDDEPIALEIIAQFCKRIGNIELTTFNNPQAGMECVMRTHPDILFLDIEMGGVNGVELARSLPQDVFLIFTTAYAEYAIDGFELNAVDFLHKPFSFSRFEKAIKKASDIMTLRKQAVNPVMTEECITVKVEYKNTNIRLADILYIESMDNYIKFYLTDQKPVLSQMSMKNVQELLPADKFIRVHKSYIVPVHRISSFNSKQIILYNNFTIPVGRVYSKILSSLPANQ